jgi:hypothetical protein
MPMPTAEGTAVPPEQKARQNIDRLLDEAGLKVEDHKAMNPGDRRRLAGRVGAVRGDRR